MRHPVRFTLFLLTSFACGGQQRTTAPSVQRSPRPVASSESEPALKNETPAPKDKGDASTEFQLRESDSARSAQGSSASKIQASKTEAAMKFIVLDKDKGPIKGIVISLTAPNGTKFYTEETDAAGYAEVLVPAGQKYDLVYLSLGRKDISANVSVTNEPNQNVKLTLRYKRPALPPQSGAGQPRFVLSGVNFDTGKAKIRPESFARLDAVAEFLMHTKHARIEISGHTDNVGNAKTNKALSQKRAQACRDYLVAKGIEADRVVAIGFGDERPVAANDTEDGRQQNRRIEATEL